ncbi:hypothetical protein predicted by Glimmer/Critica [Acetobacter ghanensis]|uniref:Uncharacterized protein n=1 Tax=Acetobacter ghanensis TaxID=431306 RepID=A0A0U5F4V6_9PROT|nr:hypothetical protein predicted by Glimmer/Critica [Acetobacter ghanensis]
MDNSIGDRHVTVYTSLLYGKFTFAIALADLSRAMVAGA